jgi:hypothetical protein
MDHILLFFVLPVMVLGWLAGMAVLYAGECFARQQGSIMDFLGLFAMVAFSLVMWGALYRWVSRRASNSSFLGYDRTGWQVIVVLGYLGGIAFAVMIKYLQ